jgi:hypothetical protein
MTDRDVWWTRALAAGATLAVALLVAAPAGASPQSNVTPFLDCIDVASDGSFTAHFGYANSWTNKITVPAGHEPPGQQNWFVPVPVDRGQPSQFDPGTYRDVFTVAFTPTAGSPALEWRLGDANGEYGSVTADIDSPRCTPVPAAAFDSPWPIGAGAIGLGLLLATSERRRRSAQAKRLGSA